MKKHTGYQIIGQYGEYRRGDLYYWNKGEWSHKTGQMFKTAEETVKNYELAIKDKSNEQTPGDGYFTTWIEKTDVTLDEKDEITGWNTMQINPFILKKQPLEAK